MDAFEKLGAFYLGRAYDLEHNELTDELVLYDSKDLTTHAVIIGMTGSGKTGLGIGMLEEAAIDGIPVIAIDPKGDMGNMLLTFPQLRPEDFAPWVNPQEAQDQSLSVEDYAKAQAELWRKGLAQWGQDGERIQRLRDAADLRIYTPGSNAGLPVSVLSSFKAPAKELRDDRDTYQERIQATATSLLALLQIEADPITSREHILIANILKHQWDQGKDIDIAGIIGAIQKPPMDRVGVMDIETFYPAKERFGLAMSLNNLLAAPGFDAWLEGEPLDAGTLLYNAAGKPKVSVLSIAHLSEQERMFFVCMLLSELIGWMRTQSGSRSLRAILYMDEIFGYIPPVANPPSKVLFLTLLKQARAYGLGLVLSTQNPVDLDYKGLANAGTWFIGRMQTERDKERVMDGLRGAADDRFDSKKIDRLISALGKRVFLLHNVHDSQPIVFNTRWVMSYLAGPMTRQHIKALGQSDGAVPAGVAGPTTEPAQDMFDQTAPALSPDIDEYFVPALKGSSEGEELVYQPMVIAAADVGYSSARYNIYDEKRFAYLVEYEEGPLQVNWDEAEPLELELEALESDPVTEASFASLPGGLGKAANYRRWQKRFKSWLRRNAALTLFRSPTLKAVSNPAETERDFRIRLHQLGQEQREQQVEKLRKRYRTKMQTLENRLERSRQRIEREEAQSKQRTMDTAISFGTAVLGAFLGRKRVSVTSASRVGSAMRKAGSLRKEAADVRAAKETAATVQRQAEEVKADFDREVDALEARFNAQAEELKEITIKPKSTEMHIHFVGLGWLPYLRSKSGRLRAAWR